MLTFTQGKASFTRCSTTLQVYIASMPFSVTDKVTSLHSTLIGTGATASIMHSGDNRSNGRFHTDSYLWFDEHANSEGVEEGSVQDGLALLCNRITINGDTFKWGVMLLHPEKDAPTIRVTTRCCSSLESRIPNNSVLMFEGRARVLSLRTVTSVFKVYLPGWLAVGCADTDALNYLFDIEVLNRTTVDTKYSDEYVTSLNAEGNPVKVERVVKKPVRRFAFKK